MKHYLEEIEEKFEEYGLYDGQLTFSCYMDSIFTFKKEDVYTDDFIEVGIMSEDIYFTDQVYGFELLDKLPFYLHIRLFQKKSYKLEDERTHDVYELYKFKLVDCLEYQQNFIQAIYN